MRFGARTAVAVIALTVTVCGCAPSRSGDSSGAASPGGCVVRPLRVTVTVDQWGKIVSALAGACAEVTTVIAGSTVDPHEYEPTAHDAASFSHATLVVMNGLGYDHWAGDVVRALPGEPVVVDAGKVVGAGRGDDPHLWYSPAYVYRVADAVTHQLGTLRPAAAGYFAGQHAAWRTAMKAYDSEIAVIRRSAAGRSYAATEGVFGYLAHAVGLRDVTPQGYRNAAANDSEPGPRDVDALDRLLEARRVAVLIVNTQTEGALPARIRSVAAAAGVPVVEVTETVPPGVPSFAEWQVDQLRRLAKALRA